MGDPEVTTGLQYPKMVIHDLNDLGEHPFWETSI